VRKHLTYANVMATLAVVLVVAGGTAYAANTIGSTDIINGQVKSADIGTGQVQSVDVKNDGLQGADIADSSLNHLDVALDGLTAQEINESLTGNEIADGGLTGDDIAPQSGVDTCIAGSVRLGPMCAGAANLHNVWGTAERLCADLDLRLPTLAEALTLARNHDIPNVDQDESFWTDHLYPNNSGVTVAYILDDAGDINSSANISTDQRETVCVTTPTN